MPHRESSSHLLLQLSGCLEEDSVLFLLEIRKKIGFLAPIGLVLRIAYIKVSPCPKMLSLAC